MKDSDLYWLAGLLEGEGCFIVQTEKLRTSIALEMTDEDVVARVAILFEVSYHRYFPERFKNKGYKPSFKCSIRGSRAVDIMKLLLPLMGLRRSKKIKECISSYSRKDRFRKVTKLQTINILKMGKLGKSAKEIAANYNITHWRVYQILRGDHASLI